MSLDRAIQDLKRFSQGEFTAEITFTQPSGGGGTSPVTVRGFVSKHNLTIDPETGNPINAKNAHISVQESVLTDAGYVTRSGNEISLYQHQVEWTDASGISFKFLIDDVMPSETFGLLVLMLGELKDG